MTTMFTEDSFPKQGLSFFPTANSLKLSKNMVD
jgi:hypothetical protein